MRWLSGVLVLIGLTACSSWPDYGHGGMAEKRPLAYPTRAPGAAVTQADALYSRLALAERHLDILRLKGAELCLPATVHKVAKQLARTRRELQGQLTLDAANDQLLVESQLIALEQRLDYLLENGSCVLDSALTVSHANTSAEGRLLNRRVEISVVGERSCGRVTEEDRQ